MKKTLVCFKKVLLCVFLLLFTLLLVTSCDKTSEVIEPDESIGGDEGIVGDENGDSTPHEPMDGEADKEPSITITLNPVNSPVTLCKSVPNSYLLAARKAYVTEAYSDYKTSIISNYSTKGTLYYDTPLAVPISWSAEGDEVLSYTLTLATDADFTQNVRVIHTEKTWANVYNLLTSKTYYYKVTGENGDGYSCETAPLTLQTADTVRWIYADGVRNVRDLGGWNGLNQGLIYRGSELNLVGTHGLQITSDGITALVDELGIKTDLDFRAASENGNYGTSSPLGSSVTWRNIPIGNFLSAFNGSYTEVMRTFTDYSNYPVYMHCWGGADRTGTVALFLAGLCGASEEDLAIDLELTSFSIFGYRYRYDNTSFLYASTLERVKSYGGATLKEKFESCFREVYGFTEAEISNIQAINTQQGAVYRFADDQRGDIRYNTQTDECFSFSFVMRDSSAVTSVTLGNVELRYDFHAGTSTLTVYGDKIADDFVSGIGYITFDDGATLRFYLETERADAILSAIQSGDHAKLFAGAEISDSNGFITVLGSSFEISASMADLLFRAGIACVDLALPTGVTVTVYSKSGAVLHQETLTSGKILSLPLDGGRIAFSSTDTQVRIMGSELVSTEEMRFKAMVGGDYKAFFGTGTNETAENGSPVLRVNSENFTVSSSMLRSLTSAGYTHITFSVDITFASGTDGCYLAIRHAGLRYERTYPALASVNGHIRATVTLAIDDTTNLQLITRTCSVDENGDPVVASGYTQVMADSFTISNLSFLKNGTENVVKN